MYQSIIIGIITILSMLFLIIRFPKFKIGKIEVSTFWLAPTISALLVLIFKFLTFEDLKSDLFANTPVAPYKILILFFSMTFISIVLDELNFFEWLANIVLRKTCNNQKKLFIIFYLLISVLTMFTSNDIVVLTFTPFIVFFTRKAKINPIPYLFSEFVAANTWSMVFIIGNPTNIYLATYASISFVDYFIKMILPTFLAGLTSFFVLFLLFRKELKNDLVIKIEDVKIKSNFMLIINLLILGICTVFLIVSSYINIEMYFISFLFAFILLLFLLVYSICKKDFKIFMDSLKRIPWSLAPFVISMFIIVLLLNKQGVTSNISSYLGCNYSILKYGILSTIACNLVNNIPMSVLFSNIIVPGNLEATYATIIGSNLGTFLTPLGALAGIMWLSILKRYDINFKYVDFIKYGLIVVIPTLLMALLGLYLVI